VTQEIPLRIKYRDVSNGHHQSRASNSGVNRHRGEADKNRLAAAQDQTRRNQKILVLAGGRKRAWRWSVQ
jgi:hypothetical protein